MVGRGDYEQAGSTAVEQRPRIDFIARRRLADVGIGECGEHRLGGGVHRRELTIVRLKSHGRPMAASGLPLRSRTSSTSATSALSTQRTTSPIVAPALAAAKSSGASSFSAVAYQNAASSSPELAERATEQRLAATRRAPPQSDAAASGDHDAP